MDEREWGRAAYQRRAWDEAFRALGDHDRSAGLSADDLELFATAAYLLSRNEDAWAALGRAHAVHLAAGDRTAAARCAFWLGIGLLAAGEAARANGWFSRMQRLLEGERDCVERGYLLVLAVFEQLDTGDWDAARTVAQRVAEIGERFGDQNLVTFALIKQGRALLKQGRTRQGLVLLDEGMLAVTAGELSSPLFTGLLYCSVIDGCQEVYELRRAGEWTDALAGWCEQQPAMVNFTGLCLVHRAEILQQRGAWPDALTEARRAEERLTRDPGGTGAARYRQAEVHRLAGDFDAAEAAYVAASMVGWQPQPGLAQLRMAQGRAEAAASAISRVLDELTERLDRARLLPACVEIMLAADDLERARRACRELEEVAELQECALLSALAAHARGTVALADGDPRAALVALRQACQLWQHAASPTSSPAAGSWSARPAGPSTTRTPPGSSWGPPGPRSPASGRRRTWLVRLAPAPDRRPVDPEGGPGAAPGGHGSIEPGCRVRAGPERADGRTSREQHPQQARRAVPGGGHRLRAPQPPRLTHPV